MHVKSDFFLQKKWILLHAVLFGEKSKYQILRNGNRDFDPLNGLKSKNKKKFTNPTLKVGLVKFFLFFDLSPFKGSKSRFPLCNIWYLDFSPKCTPCKSIHFFCQKNSLFTCILDIYYICHKYLHPLLHSVWDSLILAFVQYIGAAVDRSCCSLPVCKEWSRRIVLRSTVYGGDVSRGSVTFHTSRFWNFLMNF